MKLDELDLESLELDIAAIRRAGSVKAYAKSKTYSDKFIISKLERLLNELKEVESDG